PRLCETPSPGTGTGGSPSPLPAAPSVYMKSFVTSRTVSVGPTSVSVPLGPFVAFQSPSTTGSRPLQWNVTWRPDTCGNRPVPPLKLGLQNGWKPFPNAP